MKTNVSNVFISNSCAYLAEIEVDGKYITLYQYSKRKYYICIENEGNYEFSSRKAVDKFITNI